VGPLLPVIPAELWSALPTVAGSEEGSSLLFEIVTPGAPDAASNASPTEFDLLMRSFEPAELERGPTFEPRVPGHAPPEMSNPPSERPFDPTPAGSVGDREPAEQLYDLGELDIELVTEPAPSGNERDAAFDATGAAEIAMIATEIDALSVPPAEREQLQSALLGLSLSIERGTATWSDLRATAVLVMGHPALARRVMPVLTPFIERAG